MVNSNILNNLKKFRSSATESTAYSDIRFDGIKDDTINISNGQALVQNFKIWLLSSPNDYWRNDEKGGILYKHLVKKPMNEDNARLAESMIKAEANRYFPNIIIEELNITPDLRSRRWLVNLVVIDIKTGLIGSDNAEIPSEDYGNI